TSFVHILPPMLIAFRDHLKLLVTSFLFLFLLNLPLFVRYPFLAFQVDVRFFVVHFVFSFVLGTKGFVLFPRPVHYLWIVLILRFLLLLISFLKSNHNYQGMLLILLFPNGKLYRQFYS